METPDKTKMDIDTFNGINKSIAEILKTIEPFTGSNISTARMRLMDAGKSISEGFYRYEQKAEEEK